MNQEILNQVITFLKNHHLCCLIGNQPDDDTKQISWVNEQFYNQGFITIKLNIEIDINRIDTREHSTQGWYETFFNLILGRSSFTVTPQQRREIRKLSSTIDFNPFEKFYEILENIAQANQRSFLLHLTQLHSLEDSTSNLSERDIRLFLEAIDSYCANRSSNRSESLQTGLYFFLEGTKFPKSEALNNPQILGLSIIDLNLSSKASNIPISPNPTVTLDINSQQTLIDESETIEPVLNITDQSRDLNDLDLNLLSIDDNKSTNDTPNFIENPTINVSSKNDRITPLMTAESKISDPKSKVGHEWLPRSGLFALCFIGSVLLVPVILSQPQAQLWLNISPLSSSPPNIDLPPTSQSIEPDSSQITPSSESIAQTPKSIDDFVPTPVATPIFDKSSFPKATCGDPLPSNIEEYPINFYPVFIDPSDRNLQIVTSQFCRDAYAMTKKDTGNKAIQVASFRTREQAQAFADFLKREVGSGEVGPPTVVPSK